MVTYWLGPIVVYFLLLWLRPSMVSYLLLWLLTGYRSYCITEGTCLKLYSRYRAALFSTKLKIKKTHVVCSEAPRLQSVL